MMEKQRALEVFKDVQCEKFVRRNAAKHNALIQFKSTFFKTVFFWLKLYDSFKLEF